MKRQLLSLFLTYLISLTVCAQSPQHQVMVSQKIAAGAWTPASESGLHIWLKGDDAATGTITTWSDASGGSRNATGVNTPEGVAAVLNGHKIVRFNYAGPDYFTFGDVVSSLTAAHIFVVIKLNNDPPAVDAATGIWDFGSFDSAAAHFPYTDGTIYDDFGSTTRRTVGNPTPSLASWRLYEVISINGEWTAKLDNSQIFTTASNAVGFTTTPLFGRSTSSYHLDGDVAELILYDHKLTSTANMISYINTRFGLSIS